MSVEVDGQRFKEIEIMAAEMETRLRDSVLRVLRPTLAQVSELDLKQQDLLTKVHDQGDQIGKVDDLESNIVKQGQYAKILEDAVMATSNEVRELETTTGKQFVELKTAFEASQLALSGYKNDVLRLSREDTRIWDEATRLQQQHDEDVQMNRDHIHGCHRRIARVREEFEGHILVINQQREQLMEDLWGEGRGLNQVNRDIKQLNDFVAPIPDMMRQIAANERAVNIMAKRQEAFEKEFVQNRVEWQEYVKKQDVAVVEMRADFKKQCNHLVAHNSEIMKDIRRDYTEEIAYIQETRLGIARTLEELGRTLEDMEDKLAIERRRIDVIHSEICKEIEDLHRWRNTDRAFMEADIHQFRTSLQEEKDGQTHLRGQVDHMVRLMGLLLEGCRVASALSIQDFADRSHERWLCFRGEQMQAVEPWKASELEKHRHRREDPRMSEDPVTDLKGRGGLVRSAYKPGQVLFGGHHFDRQDLLILHGRLLAKAQQAYIQTEPQDAEAATPKGLDGAVQNKAMQGAQGAAKPEANGAALPSVSEEKFGYPPQKSSRGAQPSPRANVTNWRRIPASEAAGHFAGEQIGKNTQLVDGTKLPAIQTARGKEVTPKVATPPMSRPGTGNE